MISIIITSFKEPKTIGRAIEAFQNQKGVKEQFEIIVAAPDEETLNVARKYAKKDKKIKIFKDPGKGKSYALNLLLAKIKGEIIILSDGDVYVSENSVQEILKKFEDSENRKFSDSSKEETFEDKKVGCVSGRPVSIDSKNNIFGYWSHLLTDSAHKLREKSNKKGFLECSGYLWAFRNKIIKKFPLDVGEDTIVPIMFYLKGMRIEYAPKAKVFVSYPKNLKDFLKQKRRTAGAHDNISEYVSLEKIPRMKTFLNELSGSFFVLVYPRNFKELFYTFLLFPVRFYIWLSLIYNLKIKGRKYTDSWKRIESTK